MAPKKRGAPSAIAYSEPEKITVPTPNAMPDALTLAWMTRHQPRREPHRDRVDEVVLGGGAPPIEALCGIGQAIDEASEAVGPERAEGHAEEAEDPRCGQARALGGG